MAVTKTHPIKSTLKAAIDYILNPEKTDGKLLASSFGCGLETADIEFAWTREAAGDRGTHLGRHLIQSFAVGETTPEEAHKIGMELAGAVLGGKYEFVLTTHVDKDHLHNHLIFNAVSFVDYKKYHSNKQSYHFIRRTSDRICKEHGLSVVVPGQDKGKSYAEYTAEKQGTSYKAKLKTAIDTLIPQVKDFDELLRRLQEMGYEIKQGKYISFRAAGQERFTRTKTLGAAYTEEAIKERIKGVYIASRNMGSMASTMHKAAVVVPALSFVKKNSGSPIATAAPKQSNCLLVRLNITLLLILVKSFGTVTYAISNLLSGKPYVAFDFISPYVPTRGMLPCKQFNTR